MSRPGLDDWYLDLARLVASRSTCVRRAVGCVLVNARNQVLATGYNGVAAGSPHCNEVATELVRDDVTGRDYLTQVYPNRCCGAAATSGQDLDACDAIHAEQNALLQCHDVYAIETCYVTVSPCVTCAKLLLNTGCQRIIAVELYPSHGRARELWQAAGRVLLTQTEVIV